MAKSRARPVISLPEVFRRATTAIRKIRTDANCNHILINDIAYPDACIKLPFNDIDKSIINAKLDMKVWVALKQMLKPRPEYRNDSVVEQSYSNRTGWLITQRAQSS